MKEWLKKNSIFICLICAIVLHGYMTMPKQNRFEIVPINEIHWAVYDTETDKIYIKGISKYERLVYWTEEDVLKEAAEDHYEPID